MKNSLRNQRGQFVIESVLLIIVLMGVFTASVKALQDNKFMAKIVEEPWGRIQGMLECGVWGAPTKVCKNMASSSARTISLDPRK